MSDVASASINSFGPSPKAGFESPSEQLIVLSYAQLQDLIKGAIEQAIQPLHDEVAQLREEIDQDRQEIAALRLKMASLEKDRDTLSENQLIQLRLIHGLKERRREPTPAETSRAEKIERYLSSRPDHRATYETLRGHLGIGKDLLNDAIGALLARSPGKFKIVRAPGDRRKRALVMLPK